MVLHQLELGQQQLRHVRLRLPEQDLLLIWYLRRLLRVIADIDTPATVTTTFLAEAEGSIMDDLFDEFSESLTESMPRHESLRRLRVVLAGAVLSPLGLGAAWAGRQDP